MQNVSELGRGWLGKLAWLRLDRPMRYVRAVPRRQDGGLAKRGRTSPQQGEPRVLEWISPFSMLTSCMFYFPLLYNREIFIQGRQACRTKKHLQTVDSNSNKAKGGIR
ncbi:hypothetical protein SH139x_004368 [Planctomycetaceae bacterium SH139]